VAESEVYAHRDGSEKLVSKAMVTLALVTAPSGGTGHGRRT